MENLQININKDDNIHDNLNTMDVNFECHVNKLCDDTLILIMSMLPWKQRISIERVCKRWQLIAKQAWHKQGSLHFQSVFKRFEGKT